MKNSDVASKFNEMADILEIIGGNRFKVRSYREAARSIRDLTEPLADLAARGQSFQDLPGVGRSHAKKIEEILETGTTGRLEELRQELPEGLTELLKVDGLGPKRARQLHEELGIEDLSDLRRAAEEGEVRELEGLGAKTEQKMLKGLERLDRSAGRIGIKRAAEEVAALGELLDPLDQVERWVVAGSFRRARETVGDLDVLIEASDREATAEALTSHGDVDEVLSRGRERVSVRLRDGLQVDYRFFETPAFGAAMLYFTGSKSHNIALRQRVVQRGWKLNEYGLFEGGDRLAGASEEEVYQALDLDWIPPELREDRGELEAAAEGELPRLLELDHIRGDLHAHTTETDGRHGLEQMAGAARDRGYDYLAITDHSRAVRVARGMDEERLRAHAERIRELDARLDDLWLLAGVEVDILEDGSLDLDPEVLAELDWVVASVHSAFRLEAEAQTERLLAAIDSGVVHCLGHPSGRMIGSRDPIDFDVDRVFRACRDRGVFLELNGHPDRLDLSDAHCRRAKDLGAQVVVSTDAHKTGDLDLMRYGVAQARRGWLERGDVLNTVGATELRRRLGRGGLGPVTGQM